jgi:hypothetical protein
VAVVCAFALVILLSLRGALVVDGWMDLVSGRLIAHHGLPSHDSLTVMAHGRRWVDQQWLAQIALYELVRLGGLKLALLVHAALAVGALAAVATLARRLGASARATTWISLPALIAFKPDAAVMRSQSFGYPLFALVLWLLATDARSPSRRVLLVFPALILWANLHGSAIVGAAMVALAGIARIVEERRSRVHRLSAESLSLVLLPWLCLLVSPYALELPRYYDKVLRGSDFSQFVSEWRPVTLTFSNVPVFILVVAAIWLLGRTATRVASFPTLALLATSALAFIAVRNAAWLALTAVAVLPPLLDAVRRGPTVEPRRLNASLATISLLAVVLTAVLVGVQPTSSFTSGFPEAALRSVTRHAGPAGRVFADEAYADWLLWRGPQLGGRVAYDARLELLTSRQLSAIRRFKGESGDWTAVLRGYEVVVLGSDAGPLRQALVRSKAFHLAFKDRSLVVLARGPSTAG